MNSVRASPTPALGSAASENARLGSPTISITRVRVSAIGCRVDTLRDERKRAGIDMSVRALGAADGDLVAGPQVAVACPVPTMQGRPNSRETMAACAVRPPLSVTIAATRRMTGSQSGSVMSATRTSPGCTVDRAAASRTTRTRPTAIFSPTA